MSEAAHGAARDAGAWDFVRRARSSPRCSSAASFCSRCARGPPPHPTPRPRRRRGAHRLRTNLPAPEASPAAARALPPQVIRSEAEMEHPRGAHSHAGGASGSPPQPGGTTPPGQAPHSNKKKKGKAGKH